VRNNPLTRIDPDGHDGPIPYEEAVPVWHAQADGIANAWGRVSSAWAAFETAHPQIAADIKANAIMLGVAILTRGEGNVESGPGESPELSLPTFRSAQREVMRQEEIPTSQQPVSQQNTAAGRQYTYEVPKPGGGTETKIVQRNNGTDSSHPGEPHVEGGRAKPGGQTDSIGRPRLSNDKTKVRVTPQDTEAIRRKTQWN
jgi:hypothetical protein